MLGTGSFAEERCGGFESVDHHQSPLAPAIARLVKLWSVYAEAEEHVGQGPGACSVAAVPLVQQVEHDLDRGDSFVDVPAGPAGKQGQPKEKKDGVGSDYEWGSGLLGLVEGRMAVDVGIEERVELWTGGPGDWAYGLVVVRLAGVVGAVGMPMELENGENGHEAVSLNLGVG